MRLPRRGDRGRERQRRHGREAVAGGGTPGRVIMSLPLADTQFFETTGVWIVKSIVIFAFVLGVVPLVLLLERKLIGRFQNRYGPNRVGPYGLLQPLADVLKLLSKEQSTPETGVPALMALAPAISILTAVAAFAVIPFG